MRTTLRRHGLSVLLLAAIALSIPTMVHAMTDADQTLYQATYDQTLHLIEKVNEKAEKDIEAAQETTSDKTFDSLVARANERMLDVLCTLQPLVEELTRLSGREHRAVCEYVLVTNPYLNRTALVDPIHLTSSGD